MKNQLQRFQTVICVATSFTPWHIFLRTWLVLQFSCKKVSRGLVRVKKRNDWKLIRTCKKRTKMYEALWKLIVGGVRSDIFSGDFLFPPDLWIWSRMNLKKIHDKKADCYLGIKKYLPFKSWFQLWWFKHIQNIEYLITDTSTFGARILLKEFSPHEFSLIYCPYFPAV